MSQMYTKAFKHNFSSSIPEQKKKEEEIKFPQYASLYLSSFCITIIF